jgi:hypothetical protein
MRPGNKLPDYEPSATRLETKEGGSDSDSDE